MATLEELYEKVVSDDGEKQALAQAVATKEGTAAFLAERGCDATPEELVAFFKGRACAPEGGELSEEELGDVAGGAWYDWIIDIGNSIMFFITCC